MHILAQKLCKTCKILPDLDKLDEMSREKVGQNPFFSEEEITFLETVSWQLPYSYRNDLMSY